MPCRAWFATPMLLGLLTASLQAAPHQHYDDGGAVNWKATWAAAVQASRATGKPILVEAGIEN